MVGELRTMPSGVICSELAPTVRVTLRVGGHRHLAARLHAHGHAGHDLLDALRALPIARPVQIELLGLVLVEGEIARDRHVVIA